jgi:diguanylate cyclase (GGDEF)-like protein
MRRILIAIALLLLSAGAAKAAELPLLPATGSPQTFAGIDVLRDPGGRLTLPEVVARASDFRPASSLVADERAWLFAPSTLWFRLQPRSASAGPWYLHASSALDRADVLYLPPHGPVRRIPFGTLVPYSDRQLPLYENTIVLPREATRGGTLYIRAVTREDDFGGFAIRPAAWEAVTGRARSEDRLLPELVIIGMIASLALFNLLLGLKLRDSIYYWYAVATGCFTLLEIAETGAAWRWLWPHAAVLFDVVVYAAYQAYLATTIVFASRLLKLPQTQRVLWRAIVAFFICGAAADTAYVFDPNFFDRHGLSAIFDSLCGGVLLSAIAWSGVVGWRRGSAGAGAYTVAFAGVLVGIVVGTLGNDRLLPSNGWTEAAPGLGVAWEAIFLAIALAEHIRRLRIERDALERDSLVDALTGIANRRAFDRRLEDEWRRGSRGRTALAAIVLDIDLFKSYNDTYGHIAGDDALTRVAGAIAGSIQRTDDFVARYGGEEFVALLPFCGATEAVAVADAMLAAVHALELPHPLRNGGRLSVSAGAASIVPHDEIGSAALIDAADRALYRAKASGRDRVAESTVRFA